MKPVGINAGLRGRKTFYYFLFIANNCVNTMHTRDRGEKESKCAWVREREKRGGRENEREGQRWKERERGEISGREGETRRRRV